MRVDSKWKGCKIVDGLIWYTYNDKLFGFLPSDPLGKKIKEIQAYQGPVPNTSFVQKVTFCGGDRTPLGETLYRGSTKQCKKYFFALVEQLDNPDIFYCSLTYSVSKIIVMPKELSLAEI